MVVVVVDVVDEPGTKDIAGMDTTVDLALLRFTTITAEFEVAVVAVAVVPAEKTWRSGRDGLALCLLSDVDNKGGCGVDAALDLAATRGAAAR